MVVVPNAKPTFWADTLPGMVQLPEKWKLPNGPATRSVVVELGTLLTPSCIVPPSAVIVPVLLTESARPVFAVPASAVTVPSFVNKGVAASYQ